MKKIIISSLIILAIVSAAVTGYFVYIEAENNIAVECNGIKFSKGVYRMYMINAAKEMDPGLYESHEEYMEELRNNVLDRICIDSYYHTMCIEQGYNITGADEAEVDLMLISKFIELGFDYLGNYNNNQAYLDYFGVSKADFKEYYRRQFLYKKYFLTETGQEIESAISDLRQISQRYKTLMDRAEAGAKYEESVRTRRRLEASMDNYFNQNRMEYAQCTVETVYIKFPEGGISPSEESRYSEVAYQIRDRLINGEYHHQMKAQYPDYNIYSGLISVDSTSNTAELFGEKYVEMSLTGREREVNVLKCENGYVIFKIYQINGREENENALEFVIRKEEIGSKVRKGILGIEYEPIIKDENFYYSSGELPGDIWQKLLEK